MAADTNSSTPNNSDKENTSNTDKPNCEGGKRGAPGKSKSKAPEKAPTKAIWTDADNVVLVDTLLQEKEEGRQSDSGFKSASYTACAAALSGSEKVSGGLPKSSDSCYNHWGNVRISTFQISTTIDTFDTHIAQERVSNSQKASRTVRFWLG